MRMNLPDWVRLFYAEGRQREPSETGRTSLDEAVSADLEKPGRCGGATGAMATPNTGNVCSTGIVKWVAHAFARTWPDRHEAAAF